ncbi:AmmeMemoRadiSam system protein B [Bacteroidota bacterium]
MLRRIRILVLSLFLLLYLTSLAQDTRAVRDNVGFCWNSVEMQNFIEYLDKLNVSNEISTDNLISAISPHDDYLYAGRIYHSLFRRIKAKEVIIFGVTHSSVRKEFGNPQDVVILEEFDYWTGPFGNVKISAMRNFIKSNLDDDYFMINNKAHSIEHSIEALVPFLQYYNRDIKICPLMITAMSFEKMDMITEDLVEIIADYIEQNNLILGKDIFFLISNDANHYGQAFNNNPYGENIKAHKLATDKDREIINSYINVPINKQNIKNLSGEIWNNEDKYVHLWCGKYPIIFGVLTVNKIAEKVLNKGITGKLFRYSDTFTEGVLSNKGTSLGLTAPFSLEHWVGFFSAGFYLQ